VQNNIVVKRNNEECVKALLVCKFRIEESGKEVLSYIKNSNLGEKSIVVDFGYYEYKDDCYYLSDLTNEDMELAKATISEILKQYKSN
jgi:predicted metal-dependent TIM-barrel fold hydrolase